jgi:squalene-hopene/tetraprenyl-beta-curcumene cyclase
LQFRVRKGIIRAVKYLARAQRPEGFWLPLWFGNQHAVHDENPVYGTAKVLLALADLEGAALSAPDLAGHRRSGALHSVSSMLSRGAEWLCSVQRADGGWGAPGQGPASVEETALAVEALTALEGSASSLPWINGRRQGGALHLHEAAMRGASWLVERVESGEWKQPSPIGFYFAKLWYYERLYPQIFTVAALGRVAYALSTGAD